MSATLRGEKETPIDSKGRGFSRDFNFGLEEAVEVSTGDVGEGVPGGVLVRRILDFAKEIYDDREKGLKEVLVGEGDGCGGMFSVFTDTTAGKSIAIGAATTGSVAEDSEGAFPTYTKPVLSPSSSIRSSSLLRGCTMSKRSL